MYRVVQGNAAQEPDVQPFIDLLNNLDTHPFDAVSGLFNTDADLIVARAPGRLDVMGGIADYSGSHVLEYPIAEATFVAVQVNASRTLSIVTLIENEPGRSFTLELSDFDGPVEYEVARRSLRSNVYECASTMVAMRWSNAAAGSWHLPVCTGEV